MSAHIEEWLTRMRESRTPGPAVRVTAEERGHDLGWVFAVGETTDLAELAATIDRTCDDAGVQKCQLRAFDAEGHWMGQLLHKVEAPTQIVPANAQLALPIGVEDVVQHALQASRSFAGLSFKAIMKNHDVALQMIDRLDKQVVALTRENADLRQRLADRWELTDKLHSHQLEDDLARDKSMREGRIAETFVHAAMARVFGQGTPEGQTIHMRMVHAFLRSLSDEQKQKIAEVLTDDQKVALIELLQGAGATGETDAPSAAARSPDAQASAAAAAATNAKGSK
jgi:hypothetical protein